MSLFPRMPARRERAGVDMDGDGLIDIARGMREHQLVVAAGDLPAVAVGAEGGEQARVDRQADGPGLARREIELLPAAEPLGRFPAAAGRADIELWHRHATALAGVGDGETGADRAIRRARLQPAEAEAGVAQPLTEGELRGEVVLVEPFVPDRRAFGIMDGDGIAALLPGRIDLAGPDELIVRGREGRRQMARRIDAAGEHVGDRRAAGSARIPG